MRSQESMLTVEQRARAHYLDAQAHLSARTIAELNRRRISSMAAAEGGHGTRHWFGWPLAAALGGVCAFALGLGLLWPTMSHEVPAALAELDALEALDAINLTALDEDSDFFLWLAAHDASLLVME